MAQISRPFQIALGALVLAVLAWFLAFGHHSSSTSSSGGSSGALPAAPSTATTPAGGSGGSANGSSKIYHGPAPGIEGLTKDIAKAHGAVSTSETYNQHLEEKSAAGVSGSVPATTVPSGSPAASTPSAKAPAGTPSASSTAKAPAHSHAAAPATSAHAVTHTRTVTRTHAPTRPASTKPHATHAVPTSATPSGQRAVEGTVSSGKVAVLLFWNPSGADDVAVHGEVSALRGAHLPVVVYEGNAKDVASFGAITREVPVYGTPTILIVGAKGHTSLLTGLQDAFSIRQAIEEAHSSAP